MLNNKIMAKRGVSAVVATVLIVMITVAAVAIIWSTVIPMIRNTASEGFDCYTAESNLEILTTGSYTCYNSTDSKVQISRGSKSDGLNNISLSWSADGSTITTTYADVLPSSNGIQIYEYSEGSAREITIAPIIKVGDVTKTCAKSATVILVNCTG